MANTKITSFYSMPRVLLDILSFELYIRLNDRLTGQLWNQFGSDFSGQLEQIRNPLRIQLYEQLDVRLSDSLQ